LTTKLKPAAINGIFLVEPGVGGGRTFYSHFLHQVIKESFTDLGSPQVIYYAFSSENSLGHVFYGSF
jgi:hypothetical protein